MTNACLTNDRAIDTANLLAEVADEFLYACLLLMLGENNRYQQFCKDLVSRPGQPQDAYAAVLMARVCAIGASHAVDPQQVVDWASWAVERTWDAARMHVLGLVYDRAGQFDLAIATLMRSNSAAGWSEQAKSQNWLVLAMAHHRLGQTDSAQQCMATARRLISQARPSKPDGPALLAAPDWIELNVLLREAESLLSDSHATAASDSAPNLTLDFHAANSVHMNTATSSRSVN